VAHVLSSAIGEDLFSFFAIDFFAFFIALAGDSCSAPPHLQAQQLP
jgi:hypothetical protein